MGYFLLPKQGKPDFILKKMESLLSELGLPFDWAIYGRYIKFYSLGSLNSSQLKRICSLECVLFFEPKEKLTSEFHDKSGLKDCNGVCSPFVYNPEPLKEFFSGQPEPVGADISPTGF